MLRSAGRQRGDGRIRSLGGMTAQLGFPALPVEVRGERPPPAEQPPQLKPQAAAPGQWLATVTCEERPVSGELLVGRNDSFLAESRGPDIRRSPRGTVPAEDSRGIVFEQRLECFGREAPVVTRVPVLMEVERAGDQEHAIRTEDALNLLEAQPESPDVLKGTEVKKLGVQSIDRETYLRPKPVY